MLNLNDLSIQKGDFLFEEINLHLENSKIHILLGPSGSGKTLLLETILGINPVALGQMSLNGVSIEEMPIESRSISYVPQDLCLFPHLKVKENILFSCQFSKKKTDWKRFERLCEILQIKNLLGRSISNLSGGEKQRVAIARALMVDEDLLLLDEPFSSLHEKLRQDLWQQLKEIQKEFQLSILMVTHDLDEALFLGDFLYLMMDQKIEVLSQNDQKIHYPSNKDALQFLGVKNFLVLPCLQDNPLARLICNQRVNGDLLLDQEEVEIAFHSNDVVICREIPLKDSGYFFEAKVTQICQSTHGFLVMVQESISKNHYEVFVTKSDLSKYDLLLSSTHQFFVSKNNFILLNESMES
ncbi:ATP-binding cassette domain-containing protein [bacterium]|nr:ATP-binding cassette domain-containing protein [bacterium]